MSSQPVWKRQPIDRLTTAPPHSMHRLHGPHARKSSLALSGGQLYTSRWANLNAERHPDEQDLFEVVVKSPTDLSLEYTFLCHHSEGSLPSTVFTWSISAAEPLDNCKKLEKWYSKWYRYCCKCTNI
uniref:Uncharacterized protein n=1 Tax=Mycena chlorophos TaxID=658473 RepID=A0ABQ0LB02_MYCCL|nr:predicted protein [Mycena chlorophos]